jgi:hypothetical protein
MDKETNEQRWAARVADWRASGLTSTAYCQGRDFTAGGLRNWAYVLKERGVATPPTAPSVRLVRVETPAATRRPAAPPSITPLMIEFGAVRIAVPSGFDRSTLRAVLDVLTTTSASAQR